MELYRGKISVLMPAYNESDHIYRNIKETWKVFSKTKCSFEIVVVDDGSTDGTRAEAENAAAEYDNVKVVHYADNNGKGNALKEGFKAVTGDYVVFLDSDLDLHPIQLHRLFKTMRNWRADVVIGSKHHPDSKLEYPVYRKVISRVYAVFLKVLFNLLALDLWEDFRLVLYLGSHYHVPSSLYSYICYPFFFIFGPGDLAMEVPTAIFHLLTIVLCYKLGTRLHNKYVGIVAALLVAWAPIHLVQIYTIPDLTFAVFLNVWGLYLYLTGCAEKSAKRCAAGGLVYAFGCFQAIYSVLLLPFFVVYSLIFLFERTVSDEKGRLDIPWSRREAVVTVAIIAISLPSLVYLFEIFKVFYLYDSGAAYLLLVLGGAFAYFYLNKKSRSRGARQAVFALSFLFVSLAALGYFDLIVQYDHKWFGRSFGYYLDATLAGGYDGRPSVMVNGAQLRVFGMPIFTSVLTSILSWVGKDFARVSYINWDAVRHLYEFYFTVSYPFYTRVLFYIGLATIVINYALMRLTGGRPGALYLYPVVLVLIIAAPFVDLGPGYFSIRRIYIMPVPYLVAAFGVVGVSALVSRAAGLLKPQWAPVLATALVAVIGIAASIEQAQSTNSWIFERYRRDKAADMYYKLFYGHYYGRSYKELGAFLQKDAPEKQDGHYSAALVYTIPEDSRIGRSLPLYNTASWYSANRVLTIYDFKKNSAALYGTHELLGSYLATLFERYPHVDVIYFADFNDDVNNFSYFSKVQPELEPYAEVDDDGVAAFDSILYRFDRATWRATLDQAPSAVSVAAAR